MAGGGRCSDLQEIFDKYATVVDLDNGIMYMTIHTFLYTYLDIGNTNSGNNQTALNQEIISRLCRLISKTKPEHISYSEFKAFEEILAKPDALYRILFMLMMNTGGCGGTCLTLEEFANFMKSTENQQQIPDLVTGSNIVKLYFGSCTPPAPRSLPYTEFCQFLHDFNEEFMVRIFKIYDTTNSGRISFESLEQILIKYKLIAADATLAVASLLEALHVDCDSKESFLPFSIYSTVIKLLDHMPVVKLIYLKQSNGSKSVALTYEDLLKGLNLNKKFDTNMSITPSELQLLFKWAQAYKSRMESTLLSQDQASRITYTDLLFISPDKKTLTRCEKIKRSQKHASVNRSYLVQLQENSYRFFLGALAGSFGGLVVYPIDLVKTRMQNQRLRLSRSPTEVELMYKNSFDCAKKVLRNEGFLGLYRGLGIQLLGVAPEKAVKLAVNDFMREKLTNSNNCSISTECELISGAVAGSAQVIVSNPLEIVKIRLQTAEAAAAAAINLPPSPSRPSAMSIVKELGVRGLYKGVRACVLRDAFFSAVYFTGYANIKERLEDDEGYNAPASLLVAGVLAGIPATSIATPADVIKTRLQVIPKPGQTVYNGILDCTRKIYREEGLPAFLKGMGPRILRSAPQFGITILGYELLQRYLYIDFGGRRPKGSLTKEQQRQDITHKATIQEDVEIEFTNHPETSQLQLRSDQVARERIGGYKHAPEIFENLQTKFGFKYLTR